MSSATEFAKTALHAAPAFIAASAVFLTTMEPVCQVVKGVWNKHVLKVDETSAKDRYDAIEKKSFSEGDLKERATKIGTAVNNHRPYAGADAPRLIAGFLLGVVALKSLQ